MCFEQMFRHGNFKYYMSSPVTFLSVQFRCLRSCHLLLLFWSLGSSLCSCQVSCLCDCVFDHIVFHLFVSVLPPSFLVKLCPPSCLCQIVIFISALAVCFSLSDYSVLPVLLLRLLRIACRTGAVIPIFLVLTSASLNDFDSAWPTVSACGSSA